MNETLDPSNWDEMRQLGHLMVDDVITFLSTIREQPVWRPIPEKVKETFSSGIPTHPSDAIEVYEDFKRNILPYNKGNVHPRFFAFVQGTGTPMGVFAEMLAAAMNPNLAIGEHSAMYVENQVLQWCKEFLGYPMDASGILLSGGSMANFTALQVARNHILPTQIRKTGLHAQEKQFVAYCSTESHSCIQKAIEALGIGSDNLRKIPVNEYFQIDIQALTKQLKIDKENNLQPFCIIGNAGTVNTGAVDPLNELLAICRRENIWFHVDGAFGALAKVVPDVAIALKPIEEADSVAFDLHKWMYMPYEVGCVLIKNKKAHRDTFALNPSYLQTDSGGLAGGPEPFNNFGIELSRGFKALKVWMSLKEKGSNAYIRMIEKNCLQAQYLGALISENKPLELLTPVTMNIVCYRYHFPTDDPAIQNEQNKKLLLELQQQGIAAPSSTILNGHFVIRVANVNQRSQQIDFDILVKESIRIGNILSKQN
jgi:glutamate/tyrosine decarboxylase-like PLP-dependent enzyme